MISVATPTGYTASPQNQTTEDLDSDNPAGEAAAAAQGSVNETYDFGFFSETGAIGNYVWLDEDGDGDQDAGEAGIPNVLVTLTGNDFEGNPVTLTTYTDANGGYIFPGLPPSDAVATPSR